jgi:hypothetical protein
LEKKLFFHKITCKLPLALPNARDFIPRSTSSNFGNRARAAPINLLAKLSKKQTNVPASIQDLSDSGHYTGDRKDYPILSQIVKQQNHKT